MEFINNEEHNEMISISNHEYNELKLLKEREERKQLIKNILVKQYKHEFYTLNYSDKIEHCKCCCIDIKCNSLYNHNKSKKHLLNLQK